MKNLAYILVAFIFSLFPYEVIATSKISGDISHFFHRKCIVKPNTGQDKKVLDRADIIRLFITGKERKWNWRIGFSTLWQDRLYCAAKSWEAPNNGIKLTDFHLVEAYGEKKVSSNFKLRLGRTRVPFLKLRSQLLWSKNIYWDGLFAQAKDKWHFGAFEIHHDLKFKNNKLFIIGKTGKKSRSNFLLQWRAEYFSYDLNNNWPDKIAKDYEIINLYGKIDFDKQISLAIDLSQNTHKNKINGKSGSGTGIDTYLAIGKLKKAGNFQFITQYLDIGPLAVPARFTSFGKRINVKGWQYTLKYKLAKNLIFFTQLWDWKRKDNSFSTIKSYKRWLNKVVFKF
jgi:hypothetical protein